MTRPFTVILVHPRDPNNIGAAARAMANFGLSELRLVDPFTVAFQDAVSAVGAQDILKNARIFDTLPQALADCPLSLATSALRNRRLNQSFVTLPHLPDWLQTQAEGKTALVFGNEKSGLSNEDIERCDAALNIPTVSKQPSVNLAQAVILTCYELSRRPDFAALRTLGSGPQLPTDAQKEIFIAAADVLFEKSGFKTDFSSAQRKAILRHMLTRQGLSREQLFFLKKWAEKLTAKLP